MQYENGQIVEVSFGGLWLRGKVKGVATTFEHEDTKWHVTGIDRKNPFVTVVSARSLRLVAQQGELIPRD